MTIEMMPDIETTSLSDLFPYEENGDPDHKSHIVRGEENEALWIDGMDAQALVDRARLMGEEVTALCGHTWVPAANPTAHPVCKVCIHIWEKVA